jgi:hypothetical protein
MSTIRATVLTATFLACCAVHQLGICGDLSVVDLSDTYRGLVAKSLKAATQSSLESGAQDQWATRILQADGSVGQFVPFLGAPVDTVNVIENGKSVEKYWTALEAATWRQLLQDQFVQTLVYDSKTGASITAVPNVASVSKGTYVLVYHNFLYHDYPCSTAEPNQGRLYVGVGLRIDINATFKSGSVSLGLPQVALAASRNKVAGAVQANLVGLANSNTLTQVVGAASGNLTYESLVEASKAYAVAGQALENVSALSTPKVFGYRDLLKKGSCLEALLSSQKK